MKYVSIDIETTGLNPETCQVIEFAAVIEDTSRPDVPVEELPSFRKLVKHDLYQGEAYALALNANKFVQLADRSRPTIDKTEAAFLAVKFAAFLNANGIEVSEKSTYIKLNAAGKNFASFDLQFLKRLPEWNSCIRVSSRILDPGNLFFNPEYDDELPDLLSCKQRAGLEGVVAHDALEDARDVVRVIRKYYERKAVPA